jgi:hypothetical protein
LTPFKADRKKKKKKEELKIHVNNKTHTHTPQFACGGAFFNALLANLIYISGRLIFSAMGVGEISSTFVFSTLMHQISMMSKDYDRHTDIDVML